MRYNRLSSDYLHALEIGRNAILGELSDVLGHLAMVVNHADGFNSTQDDDKVHTSTESSSTERAATLRLDADDKYAELAGHIHAIHTLQRMMRDTIKAAWRVGHGEPIKPERAVCCDGGTGKAGNIEWHDATCDRLATRKGLCEMHYMRWLRWKRAHGQDTAADYAA